MDIDLEASLVWRPIKRPTQVARQAADIYERIDLLRLRVAKAESSSQDVYFTPRHKLAKDINRDMIKKLLEHNGVRDANCDAIHDEYLAVFCILISIGKIKHIAHFTRDPESADRYLPFLNDAGWSPQCSSFFKEFEIAQWGFCAQEFHIGRLEDMRLRPNKVIPIMTRTILQKGPDSIVEKIEIHPDYNYLNTASTNMTSTNTFVLKSYKAEHVALYYNEINAYNRLKQPEIAGNIVRLYGSWKQNQTYSILLEFVNGGTLADLFCSQNPTTSQERLSFWRNIFHIIEPVALIHRHTDPDDLTCVVEGIHQDIKPANILVAIRDTDPSFNYTFKLVDMGLAYFSTSNTQERNYRKKDGRGTQTYSAPECFRNEKDLFDERCPRDACPSKDIWSLGCVFSLALVWSVLGPAKLKTYQNLLEHATDRLSHIRDSAYVGCFHDGRKVLEEVHSMHDQVMRACATSDYIIHGLVPIITDMLEEDPSERPSAKKLRTKCQQALDRATKLSATEGNAFPIAFRLQAEMTAQRQTQQEHPYPTDYYGLGIEGTSQIPFQTPAGPVATERSTRNSPNSTLHSRSQVNGNNSIDTIISDQSLPFKSPDSETLSIRTSVGPHHREAPPHVTWSTAKFASLASHDSPTQSSNGNSQKHPNRESLSHNNHRASCNGDPVAGGTEVVPASLRGFGVYEKQREARTRSHATIDMVYGLIQKRKNKVPTNSILDELRCLPSLQKRDQIFLIDNSISMEKHWSQIQKAFEVLAYLVKDADPNGMELYFTNSDASGQQKNRTKLLRLLQSVQIRGQGGLESSLSKILDRCIRPGLLHPLLGRARHSVNIYVFTDGVWNGEDDTLCGIDDAIMRTAAKMTTRNSIGIQFIQFGDNETGTQRLQILDDGLREKNIMDIIDHTHVEDNVFKMLLGSIETYWDNQPSDTNALQRTSRESAHTSTATWPDRISHLVPGCKRIFSVTAD